MNIFSHLPIFGQKATADEAPELTEEEREAQAKAERIEFHRTQVRNGPVSFRYLSSGQQRRARERAERSAIRKNFKREVKGYFERQRVAAILRPHLQTLGLIPTATGRVFSEHEQIASTGWIVQRYGTEILDEETGAKTGVMSFRLEDVILAVKTAGQFYESATGYRISIPADFAVYAMAAEASA